MGGCRAGPGRPGSAQTTTPRRGLYYTRCWPKISTTPSTFGGECKKKENPAPYSWGTLRGQERRLHDELVVDDDELTLFPRLDPDVPGPSSCNDRLEYSRSTRHPMLALLSRPSHARIWCWVPLTDCGLKGCPPKWGDIGGVGAAVPRSEGTG